MKHNEKFLVETDKMFFEVLGETKFEKARDSFLLKLKTSNNMFPELNFLGIDFVKEFLKEKGFSYLDKGDGKEYDLIMFYGNVKVKYKVTICLSNDIITPNKTASEYQIYVFTDKREIWNIKTESLIEPNQKNKENFKVYKF